MTIQSEQTRAFNEALKIVEMTNKDLKGFYGASLSEINKIIADFKLKIDKGLVNTTLPSGMARLEALKKAIEAELKVLQAAQYKIIKDRYVREYMEAYYKIGFAIERDVNVKLLAGSTFDYVLNFTQLNPGYVATTFDTPIAGMTFLERSLDDRLRLQRQIQGIIDNAIQTGLSPKQVAEQLSKIDEAFSMSYNKAITTARTELLRGYSYGNEDSINQSKYVGVTGSEVWDATLDGRTRPSHAAKDQTKPDAEGFWHFSDGSMSRGPRLPGLSAAQAVNCRCRKIFLPFDVEPNKRGGRLPEGDWSTEFGGMDWKEWAAAQEKAGTISEQIAQKLKIVRTLN